MLKNLSISVCGVLLFWAFLSEATAQYRFDHWTADNGLPQNSVYSILQTGDGYLWLTTFDGLARFDGVRFRVFNKSNSAGIDNNRFYSLFEDAHGALWAGMEERGAVRLYNGRFSSFGAEVGFSRSATWTGDANGNAVFGTENQMFRFVNGEFSPFDAAADWSQAEPVVRHQSVKALCSMTFNNTEIASCFADGRWLRFSPSGGDGFLNYKVLSAAQDADGTLWLVTTGRELVQIENGRVARVYTERDGLPQQPRHLLTGSRFALISKGAEGALWLTDLRTMQNELLLKKTADQPFDLSEVTASYVDGEGNLWFGTMRAGLFRARKQAVTTYSKAEGLTENNVYPIYQARDSTIWIGTVNGLFTFQNNVFSQDESTKGFWINAIGEDKSGRIFASYHGTLLVRETDRFKPFEPEKIPETASINAIYANDDALWFGGEAGLGQFKDGVFTSLTTSDGLAANNVKVIIKARTGELWIGTYGGLSRLENGRLTSWTEKDGLPSQTIRSLYEDRDGALWIGTYDSGLARFKNGKFTVYNEKIGLHSNGVFQILEDERGNFWISSNRGIYRVNRDELNEFADGRRKSIISIAYGKSDGMLNAECNGGRSPSGIIARDGRFWFPTQDGVAVIDPKNARSNLQPPPVVIEDVLIENQSIPIEILNSALSGRSAINVEPDQQNFSIQYTALSFINSENLRFKYRLEGLDADWIDVGKQRTIYFSHVPAGEYFLRVIAANSDGVWNETGASLKIVVSPPFYRTFWFAGLTILTVAAIGFAFYKWRVSALERRRHLQEEFSRRLINAHETERRRIAAELHDSLGQHLAMIKNSAVFGSIAVKDLGEAKEHLTGISTQSAAAIAEVREIAYNLRPYLLDRLGLTKAIRSLLNKVADSSSLRVTAEIDDVDDFFETDAEISVYRIVQESLNNILKHAEASEIKVSIQNAERFVVIKIADDGKGFDSNAQNNGDDRGGFGLFGMAERVRMMGGSMTIKSELGRGTDILIKIFSSKR